jgi:hypothetical protein
MEARMQFQRDYLRDARRKARVNRDYFDEEDDEDKLYTDQINDTQQNDQEEVDPLDAFMQGIDAQVEKQKTQPTTSTKAKVSGIRIKINTSFISDYCMHFNVGIARDLASK